MLINTDLISLISSNTNLQSIIPLLFTSLPFLHLIFLDIVPHWAYLPHIQIIVTALIEQWSFLCDQRSCAFRMGTGLRSSRRWSRIVERMLDSCLYLGVNFQPSTNDRVLVSHLTNLSCQLPLLCRLFF